MYGLSSHGKMVKSVEKSYFGKSLQCCKVMKDVVQIACYWLGNVKN